MMKFNRSRLLLLIITLIGLFLLFYGIFNTPAIVKTISNNLFIILGSIIVVFGILYFILIEASFDTPKMQVLINILAIIATILAALLGAYLGTSGSRDIIKEQNDLAKQNAARAFYFDVLAFRSEVSDSITTYKNNIDYRSCRPVLLEGKIYSGNNAFNNYKDEIYLFDSNLSLELFNFYRVNNHLEEIRQELMQNHEDIYNHNYTYSESDWVISSLNPNRVAFIINASREPMVLNPLTSKDIYEASKNNPWGTDEDLKDCTLMYYDPNGPKQKNDMITKEISYSLALEKEIILNYEHTSSLLDKLRNETKQNNL